MPIPSPDEKLAWIRLEPPTEEELRGLELLRPGDYEIGFQRTNDILDEALEVFQRSCRSSMGIAGDVMVALFTAQGDLVNAAAGTYRSREELEENMKRDPILLLHQFMHEHDELSEGELATSTSQVPEVDQQEPEVEPHRLGMRKTAGERAEA